MTTETSFDERTIAVVALTPARPASAGAPS